MFFVQILEFVAFAIAPAVASITFTPENPVSGGVVDVSWTNDTSVAFQLILAHNAPEFKSIVATASFSHGLLVPVPFELPKVPASDGYILQITNHNNMQEVWDVSRMFSLTDPDNISTSANNNPSTTDTTTTGTVSPGISTSTGRSTTISAIPTPLSTIPTNNSSSSSSSPTSSSSSPTSSNSSPTNSASSTISVPERPDTPTHSPSPNQASNSNKSIPIGPIIGGTLGGLALILLFVFALMLVRMRHRKNRSTNDEYFSVDPEVLEATIVTPFPPTHEQSLHSKTKPQTSMPSMQKIASISRTYTVSQPFMDSTGRPSTPSGAPFALSHPSQQPPCIPVQHPPISFPQEESAGIIPGLSTDVSTGASQQPSTPLVVIAGTSHDIDDELPPPSYTSVFLTEPMREK
ncbi:hypothetical protein C0995_012103 [Termitomyces sp. Mi166|nr:hypothetical protein C0995_012103 [Termitomyces sp. Mi166\